MAERLEQIARAANPLENRFLSARQIPLLREQLKQRAGLAEDAAFRFKLGDALLNAGQNLEALAEFEVVERIVALAPQPPAQKDQINLRLNQALCHLREAERLNCLSNHNADSCLLPLQGGGQHIQPAPARRAIGILTNLLQEVPDNLAARWLLNVAAMAVGDYPERVPDAWRIPPSVFASETDFPRFQEVAPAAGVAPNELSGGSAIDDFDGDGFLDIVVSSLGLRDQMRFYHNDGNGTFTERTREAGLLGLVGGLNLVSTDYNNDGFLDLLVLRGAWMREEGRHPNSLLHNRGNGTFEDVTEAAGLLSFHPTQTAAWLDFDGDGWLDLFIGNESITGQPPHPCELFRNRGNGTFEEVATRCGVAFRGYVKGVTAGDYDNDGRPDLYLSVLGAPNRLYRNAGPQQPDGDFRSGWRFTSEAADAGVAAPTHSFPCWFFDFDNDGWEDLFASGYKISNVGDVAADYLGLPHTGATAKLYRNRGDGTFADVSRETRVGRLLHAMGANYGDLDNDGWLDFYLGTGDPDLLTIIPNRMFRNAGGRFFQDVTTAGGFGHLQKGHGISFADLDNDGDQDVYEDMGGAVSGDIYPNVLFANPGTTNHWLKLQLQGTKANRPAIGARVRIDIEEPSGNRSIHRTVRTGGSFGTNPLRLEVGLGQATGIVEVEIHWPGSATRQTVRDLKPNTAYLIREDVTRATILPLKAFRLPTAGTNPHIHHH